MTWFVVDDRFWSHPKTIGISMSTAGVWVMAGSWCMQHLTDGYIPADALPMICHRNVSQQVQDLVARNLWTPLGDGWQFVDWLQWQKSKQDIEKKRAATRSRVETWRRNHRTGGT